MTGRIKLLGVGSSSGVIESENGARLYFDAGAVLAYDVANLSVGQLVTFDSENGIGRKAVNICVQRPHTAAPTEKKRKESMLRYVGFDQTKAIRTYRFERTSFGEDTESFRRDHRRRAVYEVSHRNTGRPVFVHAPSRSGIG